MLRFDSITSLQNALTYNRERHSLISKNIANLETPGYRAVDFEPMEPLESADFRKLMESPKVDDDREPGADGNTVSLERQMAKLSETRVRYSAASTLTSKRLALLSYAAGNGA